jgi:hypothetical protein
MARSGPDAGKSPVAVTARVAAGRRPGREPSGRGSKVVVGLVALGLARHVLRSRRFQEGVAVTTIALGALRGIGQENRASTMARLSAWNKRQVQRLEARLSARPERSRAPGRWCARGRPPWPRAALPSQMKGAEHDS